jgi:hypothetical protein
MNGFLNRRQILWSAWVVAALLMLTLAAPIVYGTAVPLSALLLALVPGSVPHGKGSVDRRDLAVIALLYVGVVALFRLAFGYFTISSVTGLFLCFAAGMVLGVVGPSSTPCGSGADRFGRSDSEQTVGVRPLFSECFSRPSSSRSPSLALTCPPIRSIGFRCW